jgi:UDP-N-acetylglucosamine 1-carboxyvinyltransferase
MKVILIDGGRPLVGAVRASGAKNAALPIMAAGLLTAEPLAIDNCPDLRDIRTMTTLLTHLGALVTPGDPTVVSSQTLATDEAPYELVRTMRASILVLGPLVARFGKARVSMPGGCAIGSRPIDLHLKGLAAMGADVALHGGYVEVTGKLTGARIYLDLVSVTGTENLMMAAALAKGTTVIENAAREPEIGNLADALRMMGAKIEGDGTSVVTIEGVRELGGARIEVIPDRIEAGTLLTAGAVTGGEVTVTGCRPDHLAALLDKLAEAGFSLETSPESVTISRKGPVRAVSMTTQPYPGFPTDMQAQFMALMAVTPGQSVITETIFENRYMHVAELQRMGAEIALQGKACFVTGVPSLEGAPVMASDLRAGASLIVAGLAAGGTTKVSRVYHIDRGYQGIDAKLSSLGASIRRVPEEEA